VSAFYLPFFSKVEARFRNWKVLWGQFEDSVRAWNSGSAPSASGIIERVNEMSVAYIILRTRKTQISSV
jgi:hypothetical protein